MDQRIGDEHEGWTVARYILGNERFGTAETLWTWASLERLKRLASRTPEGAAPPWSSGVRPVAAQWRRSARWAACSLRTKLSRHAVTSCSRTEAISDCQRSLRSESDMPSALCTASATPWMS